MPHTIVRPLKRDKHLLEIHRHNNQETLNDKDIDEEKELFENFSDLGIIKQFPFSSSLQRMSVIVKELREPHFDLFTKGSPEKILEFSRPETSKQNENFLILFEFSCSKSPPNFYRD